MPLKSWIDARSPSNSSFQSFCSEGAAAAGLRQEIGQTYLITIFRTNLQMDDGDAGFHCQVIAAEGEQKASRALREAAEVIAESPSALQVQLRVTSLRLKAKVP